jgi:biotin transport system substrate-specific component
MMRTLGDTVLGGVLRRDAFVRDGLLVLAGSLLVAVCARIQVPGVVPTTLQTLAVVLVGASLGSRRGALAMVAYLLEGVAGLPVFALPAAGPGYLAGPTAGYLIGFVAAAFVVGLLAERGWDRRFATAVCAFGVGHVLILTIGYSWLSLHLGTTAAFATGVVAFLPGAAVKTVAAAAVLPTCWRVVRRVEARGDGA